MEIQQVKLMILIVKMNLMLKCLKTLRETWKILKRSHCRVKVQMKIMVRLPKYLIHAAGNSLPHYADDKEESEDVQMGDIGPHPPNQVDRNMWASEDREDIEVIIVLLDKSDFQQAVVNQTCKYLVQIFLAS